MEKKNKMIMNYLSAFFASPWWEVPCDAFDSFFIEAGSFGTSVEARKITLNNTTYKCETQYKKKKKVIINSGPRKWGIFRKTLPAYNMQCTVENYCDKKKFNVKKEVKEFWNKRSRLFKPFQIFP